MKRLMFLGILGLVLAVDASAAGSTNTINTYVDTVGNIMGDKMQYIAITVVMIFSGILAWKNASVAPLGWGGAASIAIAGSGSIAKKLKGLAM